MEQSEWAEASIRVGQGIQHLLALYELHRNPDELDFLLYQVNKLFRIVVSVDSVNREVVDAIAVSLGVLEELQRSESVVETSGYVPQLLTQGSRGRPRLDIRKEQLEYLLHMGFSCPMSWTQLSPKSSMIFQIVVIA